MGARTSGIDPRGSDDGVSDLRTPALLVDLDALDANIATMASCLPGGRLRPHVKAHKCTTLARRQFDAGHRGFTCATIREVEGMAAAGLGEDLLLANEVADASRLGRLVEAGARVTLAVDSIATIDAAARGGVREVLIDVNVGLPRCGCEPDDAGMLADRARDAGLDVRGVMGYEGHAVLIEDPDERRAKVEESAAVLAAAHAVVGGPVCSGGGTGSFDLNSVATEIQAGSYVLMDTAYSGIGLPFVQALRVLATVISVNRRGWAVADCGLKALGMDHGNPAMSGGGSIWYCSDEHVVFSPPEGEPLPVVGGKVELIPAHVDPTVAYHEWLHVTRGPTVIDRWPVDLRGW
jgi:D-serine deaminase-like pyridoxal phosphate-dependent protein